MNKKSSYRGLGFYIGLILIVVCVWYWLDGSSLTNAYSKSEFEKALKNGKVASVEVVQNREVPTGSLEITLTDSSEETLYTSDVNEMQNLMEQYQFSKYVV